MLREGEERVINFSASEVGKKESCVLLALIPMYYLSKPLSSVFGVC